MPVKERRTKILLLLFLCSEANFSLVTLSEALQSIFDVTLNQKTRGTLSALLKEGLIEKAEAGQGNETLQYKITSKGLYVLSLEFPFFRHITQQWDGLWRIISYEIPEKKRDLRDRLRREMRGWGLGPWHRSFWITPHPVIAELKDLVYGKEEEKYIQAFESTHVFGEMEVLVEKVWEKNKLDGLYRELFKKWHDVLSKELDNTAKFKEILYSYISLLRDDPGLPESLVGKKWIGLEAYDIFREVRGILLK